MPKTHNISTENRTTKKNRKETNSKKNTTNIVNMEKNVDKDTRKKETESTDIPNP